MKKKDFLWSLLAIILTATMSFGLQSCFLFPDDNDPELSVNTTSINLKANGDGNKTITVTASHTDWTASVTDGASWLQVSKNGQSASVSVDANSSTQPRNGKIRIVATANTNLSYDISVSQAGTDGTITVSINSVEFDPEGGSQSIQVTSNTGWNVRGNSGWLTINPSSTNAPSPGSETKTVNLSVVENSTKDARSCTLTFTTDDNKGSASVVVKQKKPADFIMVNGVNSASLSPFPGLFSGKSGIDYKETVTITSNVSWSLSNAPEWVSISPTNGSGTVQMTIYPKNENNTSSTRKSTITLTGGSASATLSISQDPGVPLIKVTPTNVTSLYNQIGWELVATGKVDKYRMIMMSEAVYNYKNDNELLKDINTTDAEKLTDNPVFFYPTDDYGNSIRSNSTYYIITIAYDEKEVAGELVKTKVTTPSYIDYNNDAFVSFPTSDIAHNSSSFQFTVKKEGYCNTYHLIYGNVPSSFVNYSSVLYAFEINYYINNNRKHWLASNYGLEIVTKYPNDHTFMYNCITPLYKNPVIIAYGWGVFSNGKVSSDMTGFSWDTSSDESRQIRLSRGANTPKDNVMLLRSGEIRHKKLYVDNYFFSVHEDFVPLQKSNNYFMHAIMSKIS